MAVKIPESGTKTVKTPPSKLASEKQTTTKTIVVKSKSEDAKISKLIDHLNSLFEKGVSEISTEDLKSFKMDTTNNKIEISGTNMFLKKNLLDSDYEIQPIDGKKDLFGNVLFNHEGLLKTLKTFWENRSTNNFLSDQYLLTIGIKTNIVDLAVGNFKLRRNIVLSLSSIGHGYAYEIADKERDVNGKWVDEVVDLIKVKITLKNYTFPKNKLATVKEVDWNVDLEKHFRKYFVSAHKKKTTGNYGPDLIIGGKKFALELKLLKQINDDLKNKRSAMAQIEEYKDDFNSLMLVILGKDGEEQEKSVLDLKKKAEKEGVHFYFMKAE